jgi:hypothetical protein
MAIIGAVVAGSVQPTNASNLPARAGKNDWPVSEPTCWGLNGPTIQNNCSQGKYWYMPLVSVGAGWVGITVTAQGANSSSNVECRSMGSNREGTSFFFSGWFALPQFGVARDLYFNTFVPSGGTAMIDCHVLPGGMIHTVNW